MRLHGDHRSVMVVTRQCHDPVNTPPPMFCLMLACTKGGRNRGILRYWYVGESLINNFYNVEPEEVRIKTRVQTLISPNFTESTILDDRQRQ